MKMKKMTFLIVFLMILCSLFYQTQRALGIGQMTRPISIESALRGEEFVEVLILTNTEKETMFYGLGAEGEIKEWASFYEITDKDLKDPISKIQISPESSIKSYVKFIIPKEFPNGTYSGKINFFSMPEENSSSEKISTTVLDKVGRAVSIKITDEEIIDLSVSITPQAYVLKKNEPLQINATYYNNGNIKISPDIQIEIFDGDKRIYNAIFPYSEEEAVRPLDRKTIPISYQTAGLVDGEYKALASVFLDDEKKFENDFAFTIGVPTANVIGNNTFKNIFSGSILLAVLLIGISTIVLLKSFLKENNNKRKAGIRKGTSK